MTGAVIIYKPVDWFDNGLRHERVKRNFLLRKIFRKILMEQFQAMKLLHLNSTQYSHYILIFLGMQL